MIASQAGDADGTRVRLLPYTTGMTQPISQNLPGSSCGGGAGAAGAGGGAGGGGAGAAGASAYAGACASVLTARRPHP